MRCFLLLHNHARWEPIFTPIVFRKICLESECNLLTIDVTEIVGHEAAVTGEALVAEGAQEGSTFFNIPINIKN